MLLLARTDAESARLISSTIDTLDHEFVKGTTTRGKALVDVVAEAEQRGVGPKELEAIESKWVKEHELCTFDEGMSNTHFEEYCLMVNFVKPSRQLSKHRLSLTRRTLTINIFHWLEESRITKLDKLRRTFLVKRCFGTGIVRRLFAMSSPYPNQTP